MPYIKEYNKKLLLRQDKQEETAGELNYSITRLCLRYLENHGECYQTYNDIIGVLTCAKTELYLRKITPYENKKRKENGDVYE